MVKKKFLFVAFLIFLINITLVLAVEPFGANVNNLNSERSPADSAQGIPAIAGNVTELSINGFSVTQSWQGYFGNVTGTIQLADNGDNVMYNWSLASPEGEIYASTNDSINWNYVQCLNFDSDGTYADDTANLGGTSAHGTNLTILENMFGIFSDDVDGVNETFPLLGSGHNTFYTNNLEFSEGECRNTQIFSNSGQGEDNKFEEVLLYEPTSYSVLFASLLNENVLGFDNSSHDFEMLVLENGHSTDTATTTYYFWVELE
ncbi:MAG: hypothetical protein WC915_06710 [archaeon]|jgi:hypothetical protein